MAIIPTGESAVGVKKCCQALPASSVSILPFSSEKVLIRLFEFPFAFCHGGSATTKEKLASPKTLTTCSLLSILVISQLMYVPSIFVKAL